MLTSRLISNKNSLLCKIKLITAGNVNLNSPHQRWSTHLQGTSIISTRRFFLLCRTPLNSDAISIVTDSECLTMKFALLLEEVMLGND